MCIRDRYSAVPRIRFSQTRKHITNFAGSSRFAPDIIIFLIRGNPQNLSYILVVLKPCTAG